MADDDMAITNEEAKRSRREDGRVPARDLFFFFLLVRLRWLRVGECGCLGVRLSLAGRGVV